MMMKMKKRKHRILSAVGVGIAGCLSISAFPLFNIQARWLIAVLVVIAGLVALQLFKDKELALMKIMIFFMPFRIGFMYNFVIQNDMVFACDAVLILLYFYWYINTRGFRTSRIYWCKATTFGLLFILWGLVAISKALSIQGAVMGAVLNIKAFFLFFYITNRLITKNRLRGAVDFIIIVLAIQGFIGIMQKALGRPLGLTFLGEVQASLWRRLARMPGTLGHGTLYGTYLACLVPLSMNMFIITKKLLKKYMYGIATLLGVGGLVFSLARGAWIGFAGAMIIVIILFTLSRGANTRSFRMIILVVIIVVILLVNFLDLITLRLQTGQGPELRITMMRMAIRLISQNPILGVGLFNYEYYSYPTMAFWRPVHNSYLRIASEIGLPGIFFFLAFLFIVIRETFSSLRLRDRYLNAVAIGLFGGFAAFGLSVMFGPEYQHYFLKFLIWLMAGMAVSLKRIRRVEVMQQQRLQRREKSLNQDRSDENTHDR